MNVSTNFKLLKSQYVMSCIFKLNINLDIIYIIHVHNLILLLKQYAMHNKFVLFRVSI